jgi:hypothetical protein
LAGQNRPGHRAGADADNVGVRQGVPEYRLGNSAPCGKHHSHQDGHHDPGQPYAGYDLRRGAGPVPAHKDGRNFPWGNLYAAEKKAEEEKQDQQYRYRRYDQGNAAEFQLCIPWASFRVFPVLLE